MSRATADIDIDTATLQGTAWHSPGSIYALGHKAISSLLTVAVEVQEKVDGSYFAFGLFPEIDRGEGPLRMRSKGAPIYKDAPPDMFKQAAATVIKLSEASLLRPGWMYRGEVLAKPKHHTLAYDRAPNEGIILHDICTAEETFLPYAKLRTEAHFLGLEVVPQLGVFGPGELTIDHIRTFLKTVSVLGGQEIEGVVIKPLEPLFGTDKKQLMGKFVSEKFKEAHSKVWGESNPAGKDIIAIISSKYAVQGRWQKALQHLKEAGKITNTPQDIGLLIKEVLFDVLKEEADAMKDLLFRWAWPHISRGLTRNLPLWYKDHLLTLQFEAPQEPGEAALKEVQDDAKGG